MEDFKYIVILELTAFLAEPGGDIVNGLSRGTVDNLRLTVVQDPVDAVVVRLRRLPRLRRGRGQQVGRVHSVLGRERVDERRDALVHGSLHVTCNKCGTWARLLGKKSRVNNTGVKLGAHRNRLEVNGLD